MGIYIKITDAEVRCSMYFLDFLNRLVSNKTQISDWHDQLGEKLTYTDAEIEESAKAIAGHVFDHPLSKRAVHKAYGLLYSFLIGDYNKLAPYRRRFHFICVVGAPRHGGSYLTKQLFRAIGMEADRVPDVIAHDGFPDSRPFRFGKRFNAAVTMMHTLAEYLVMVDLFFGKSTPHNGKVIVPKKATKFAYQGAFFNDIFSPHIEYVVTLRHPIPACISTYEKSGGLPPDEKFRLRGRIEQWIGANYKLLDRRGNPITDQHYFDAYLRYWEHYHYSLATSGLGANHNWRVVAYDKDRMMNVARDFFDRFDSASEPEQFHVFDKRDRHPEWRSKAEAAIRRVHAVWQAAGLLFPVEELMEQW